MLLLVLTLVVLVLMQLNSRHPRLPHAKVLWDLHVLRDLAPAAVTPTAQSQHPDLASHSYGRRAQSHGRPHVVLHHLSVEQQSGLSRRRRH